MSAPVLSRPHESPASENRAVDWEFLLLWTITGLVLLGLWGAVFGVLYLLWSLGLIKALALVGVVAGSLVIAWALAGVERQL